MEKDKKAKDIKNSKLKFFRNIFFADKKRTVLSFIILIIIVFFIFRSINSQKNPEQYQTAKVQAGTIIATVSESGNVAGISQAGVGSPTTGIVTDIFVKNGDIVGQGQNLFKVKSIATAQERASAYAGYLGAQNSLNSANAKMYSLQSALFKANQAFINDKGIPNPDDAQKQDPKYIEENAEWLQAEADYKNQSLAIAQAQASFNNASLAYQATQDSVVAAPIGGTVANISLRVGDQITASGGNLSSNLNSSSSTTTNAVLYIGDYQKPYIKLQATEVDAPNIKAGQKATITLSAFPGKTYIGSVEQVDNVGAVSSGVVTYNVFVSFVAPPENIMPGMSATVIIQIAKHENALSVPAGAVQTTNGQSTVRILKNGQVSTIDVTTGISSDTEIEILSGLSAGETVVTGTVSTGTTTTGSTASPFGGGGFNRGFGGSTVIRTGGRGG